MKKINSFKWEVLPKKVTQQIKGGNETFPDWDTIINIKFPCPIPPGG